MHRHPLARRAIAIAGATLLLSASTLFGLVATSESAGAVTTHVSNGAAFKVAFANDDIVILDANIHLGQAPDDCTAEPTRNSSNPVVIDGQGAFAIDQTCTQQRVVHNQGAGMLTVQNVPSLSGGNLQQGAVVLFGGGIWSDDGAVVVTNSTVTGNSLQNTNLLGSAIGGGIAAPTAILTNSAVTLNHVEGVNSNGGGIAVEGDLTITNSSITNNTSAGGTFAVGGGAVFAGTAVVTDSTITGNSAHASPTEGENVIAAGGGISGVFGEAPGETALAVPGSVTLVNSSVSDNLARAEGGIEGAQAYGGAVIATQVDATNTSIEGNNTKAAGDTVAVIGGGVVAESIGTFTSSSVSFNTADAQGTSGAEVLGGGIAVVDSEVHLVDSEVDGNLATADSDPGSIVVGGGIFTEVLTMSRSTLNGNRASATSEVLGGGAFTATVDIEQSQLIGNQISASDTTSEAIGGALLAEGGTINASTVATSRVSSPDFALGGGIAHTGGEIARSVQIDGLGVHLSLPNLGATAESPPAELKLVNSTLSGNSAEGAGDRVGGAIGQAPGSQLTLVYVSMSENGALAGANIGTGGTQPTPAAPAPVTSNLTSFGTVIASPLGGGTNCEEVVTSSQGYNDSTDASCGFTGGTDLQGAADPQLGPLAQNGGPTPTLLPADTSPLVDAIPVSACQADGAAGVTTDQRGVTRQQIIGCDIGAVEILAPEAAVEIAPRFTG